MINKKMAILIKNSVVKDKTKYYINKKILKII